MANLWYVLRHRCNNPSNENWHRYGGRGIKLCSKWQAFEPFRNWALANGYEDHLTIDRIDNDGNYEPGNCQWITRSENSRKRSH
jgi:hypothetical protein